MIYLTNTVQAELMLYFYTERYVPPAQADALKATAVERAAGMFARIDAHLADRPYLLGEAISAADIYLFMVSRWTRNTTRKARDLPHLRALLARVMARPQVRRRTRSRDRRAVLLSRVCGREPARRRGGARGVQSMIISATQVMARASTTTTSARSARRPARCSSMTATSAAA